MSRMIEVKYENKILKPITPIEWLKDDEMLWIIVCPKPDKVSLRELVGTLTHEEAQEMQKMINEEFERVEDEW
jgi:predicted DNA-binding antitoxin AbrB/MazE fold protein